MADTMTTNLIEAKSLTKLYGTVIGVNDVNLELGPGVRGLLGPNGSGKSTLLKLVTGQLRPTEGTVRVLGRKPWNHPALFRRVGFCPEQDAFYSFLTAFEFVCALAELSGFGRAEAKTRAEATLERIGATAFMHRPIAPYSKGMRQRTKVAQALVHDPEFVILDEPLTGTDPVGRREMIELVQSLGAEGKSVLVSSHVLHEVEAMTDEFLLIHGGRVLASGSVEEIRALLSDAPHRIEIRADSTRRAAARLLEALPVEGIEVSEEAGRIRVQTRSPLEFFEGVARLVSEGDVVIHEMHSQDDDLSAVFHHLVTRV